MNFTVENAGQPSSSARCRAPVSRRDAGQAGATGEIAVRLGGDRRNSQEHRHSQPPRDQERRQQRQRPHRARSKARPSRPPLRSEERKERRGLPWAKCRSRQGVDHEDKGSQAKAEEESDRGDSRCGQHLSLIDAQLRPLGRPESLSGPRECGSGRQRAPAPGPSPHGRSRGGSRPRRLASGRRAWRRWRRV